MLTLADTYRLVVRQSWPLVANTQTAYPQCRTDPSNTKEARLLAGPNHQLSQSPKQCLTLVTDHHLVATYSPNFGSWTAAHHLPTEKASICTIPRTKKHNVTALKRGGSFVEKDIRLLTVHTLLHHTTQMECPPTCQLALLPRPWLRPSV